MSSILKALEKVEESQSSKRPGGAAGLARRRERRPAWLIPAWVVGGAAVASLVTFSVMGGFSPSPPSTALPVATVTPLPVAVTPPTPVTALPATAPAAAPVANKAEPVARKVEAPVPAAASVPAPKAAAKTDRVAPAAVAKPAAARPVTVPAATTEAEPVPAAQAQEAVSEQPRQEIRVTGIAWQGNSESSFAMVNGRAIRQGGTVDGFKVERILEDSVSFSGSNGSITVPLGAGE